MYCDGSLHTQAIYLDGSLNHPAVYRCIVCDDSLHTQNIYLDGSFYTQNGEITLLFTCVL